MDRRRDLLQAMAILSGVNALLHVFYALSGGIADPPWRWLLALAAVLSAVLAAVAGWRGPWYLAWAAWPLMVLPVTLTWPAALASPAGQVVVLLMLVVFVGLLVETVRSIRRPPRLSPG